MILTKIIAPVSWPDPGWRSWYMMRRGCRRIASTAAIAFGTGSRSSGLSPSARERGKGGGGTEGGTAVLVGVRGSIALVFSIKYSVFDIRRSIRIRGDAWCRVGLLLV